MSIIQMKAWHVKCVYSVVGWVDFEKKRNSTQIFFVLFRSKTVLAIFGKEKKNRIFFLIIVL